MKIGVALSILAQAGRSDVAVFKEHLALGDLAEPLGFDSLFALEHHFTGYAMSPAPTQLLAYFAGRTKRVALGTAVIVLPWHDPIRVAEQIALLDILCGGRCLFGFGRGAASVEYEGFRIPMGEARPRFAEAAQIDRQGAQRARVRMARRVLPDPAHVDPAAADLPSRAALLRLLGEPGIGRDHGQARLRHAGHHAERMAQGRRGHRQFREIAHGVGHDPPPPIILTNVSCAESRDEAHERAMTYLGAQVAVDRRPLPFLRRPSRDGQRLRGLRQDGQDLRQAEGRRRTVRRRPTSTSRSRSSARPTTACSRSPSCSRSPASTIWSPNSRSAACRTTRRR